MTPEEAANFYEEDEDPREVFAWFDAESHGVTARPAAIQQPSSAEEVARVVASGLYSRIREDLLPEVTAIGSNSRYAQQA
ncbi:MAG TPA: hypothetical protein VMC03_02740 [Streptosporangiaceae bacterium]|nr:hypothetical protein [Streptosporangiaceae bacterium]